MTNLKIFTLSLTLLPLWTILAAETSSQTLIELLKDDKVSAVYTECKEKKDQTKSIEDCIWDGLDEKKREEVKKKLALAKEGSSEKESKAQYDSLDLSSGLKKADDKKKNVIKDPAIQKLEDFLAKRLDETLYGDSKKADATGAVRVVNHNIFFELQESQVGKNILSAISSYCINTNEKYLYDPSQKEANISSLKDFSESQNKETGETEKTNTSYAHWMGCATGIKKICEGDVSEEIKKDSKYAESKKQACLVTKNISNARQVLLKLEQIKKANVENSQQSGSVLQGKKTTSVYAGAKEGKDGKNIDDLTSISSSDIAKSGYEEGIKEKKKILDNCKAAGDSTSPECKKIFLTGEEADAEKKSVEEYTMRSKVLEEKISPDNITKEDVSAYLKEQGYDDEKIKAALETSLDEVKKKIAERYKAESDAIKAELSKKLRDKTISSEELKDKSALGTKIDALADEIRGKPEELKNLIHYNNVVSGFLTVTTEGGAKATNAQNVASIVRELENTEGLTEEEKKKNEELKAALIAKGVSMTDSTDAKSASLSVERINENILNYTEIKKEEKKP